MPRQPKSPLIAANSAEFSAEDVTSEQTVARGPGDLMHSAYDVMSPEAFRQTWAEYKSGSKAARDKLLLANQRLVMRYIRTLKNVNPSEVDDLFQQGHIALHRALEGYDPEQGAFGTYAMFWIRSMIQDMRTRVATDVHMPQMARKFRNKAVSLVIQLEQEGSKDPRGDAARQLGTPVAAIDSMVALRRRSLQAPRPAANDSEPAQTLEDTLADVGAEPLEEAAQKGQVPKVVAEALAGLKPMEARVIRFYYGIGAPDCEQSFAEVARRAGVTRQGAQAAYERAIRKLKARAEEGSMDVMAALA